MGDTLGGRPNSDEMYDDKNHVFYDLVAQTNVFKEGDATTGEGDL